MKNISKLLLFISLISYTFMKDCPTDGTCGGERESGKEENYACFAKDESSECTWTLYCSKVPKPSPSTGGDGRRNLETIICSDYPVENADNACVTNTVTEGETANDACMEISLCSKAKNVADPANDCQNYAKTFPNAQCVQDEEVTGTCKQQFPCLSVTKADLKKDTSIDCSKGIPTNSETHYCTSSGVTLADEEVDTTLICKEEPYCESASTDSTAKCSTFEVIDKNKGCIEDSTKAKKCVEKDLCESVTELDGTKCSDYPVVKDNSATYVCIDNIDSSTGTNKVGQPCKEEQLCTEVTADGDNCLSYPVPLDDREEQGCGKPTAEGNCIQVSLCNKATKSGTLACSDFPLTWENINTHKCINGETDTSCKEVPYCNFATPDSEKGCDGFPTQGIDTTCNKKSESECKEEPKTQNPDTDTECTTSTSADSDAACKALTITGNDGTLECVENKDKKEGDKPCMTKVIDCKNKIKDATQSICEKLTVENKEQQICRLDSTQTKCEQVTYCEFGTGENDNDCSKYALKDNNKDCKKSSSGNTCEEVSNSTSEEDNTMCQEALTGEDDPACSKYKVSNKDLNKCVHNENPAIGNTPCMEKLINCEDKKTEAKEEICDKLEVTDKNKEVCRMHSTEKKCELISYCEFGTGENDDECSGYALKNENKVCKNIKGEKKCEEVDKEITTPPTEPISTIKKCSEAKTGADDTECSAYEVTDSSIQKCIHNTGNDASTKPCIEQTLSCEEKKTKATDKICAQLKVEDSTKTVCRKDSSSDKCVVLTYCEYGDGSDEAKCPTYALKDKNKICVKKSDENKCEEKEETNEQNICSTSTTEAADDAACGLLKIPNNDGTKKCVKNSESGNATPCKEETMDCEEKEIDATEEICGKLKVSNTDEQICRLDSTNIGCKLINYCQYVKGTSDDECSKYPVKDTTKECKTNSEKNKCEEVSKPSTGSGSLIKTSIYLLLIFSILI